MPFTNWRDTMEIGVGKLDADHKGLLDIMNLLYDAIQDHRGQDVLGPLIDRLVDAYNVHFAHEDKLFQRTRYPLARQHRAEHDLLRDRLGAIRDQHRVKPDASISLSTLAFLRDYLVGHIQGFDTQFAEFVRTAGSTKERPDPR